MNEGHSCYKCNPHVSQEKDLPELESIEATFSENGEEVFFFTGYSALEIAKQRAKEIGGTVYINNVSPRIKRHDMRKPVSYAVAKSGIYTLRGPDGSHDSVYQCFWPPYG